MSSWQTMAHTPWLLQRPFGAVIRCYAGRFKGRVLDIGCGCKPYTAMLPAQVTAYVGLDLLSAAAHPDVYGDAQALPFLPHSFDALLCTYVLPHVPRPGQAFSEIARVLKPGGVLVLGASQMWHVYTTQDYYRFTASGLRYLAAEQGLEVLEVAGVGGFFGRMGAKLLYALQRLNPRSLRWLTELPVGLLGMAVQAVFALLDRLVPTPNDTVYNVLMARKRA